MKISVTHPTLLQRVLGGFVLWQLIFALSANVFFFLQRTYSTPMVPILPAVTSRWAEATGQLQGWSLFAPNVPTQAAFLMTELRWPDGRSVKLLSPTEPANLDVFFRAPGAARLLNYEAHLRLALLSWSPAEVKERPERWRQHVEGEVRRRGEAMRSYLQWRHREYVQEQPDAPPPSELVLWVRLYDIPGPQASSASWGEPALVPLMRWRPGVAAPAGFIPYEWFDVTTGQFRWGRSDEDIRHE
jgi:hypothetical protein